MKYDVVVVGSGIAGLYAALLAAPHGKVLVVTKGALEESNTRYAQGGIAVALGPQDSPELHLRDTIAAGDGLCDPAQVAILTHEAPDCILDLVRLGVPFDREAGDLALTLEAAHSLPRVLHAGGDATGAGIERSLAHALRQAGVEVQEHGLCTSLLTDGERVCGVRFVSDPAGVSEMSLRRDGVAEATASHVILASGGAGQLFARTTNPAVATGDGLAIAYRAGAELMDLEFTQFHPTALVLEGAPSFLISEAVRGEGGILRDVSGRAFMADYHPDRELAPRDVVARAIHQQMMRTGAPHVWLDITHLPAELAERRFPTILRFCRDHGVDPVREQIPVAPAAHYLMGGVRTDCWSRTSLPGLFACGEAACTGVHGANRLASNSLLEGLVFARRAVQCIVSGRADGDRSHPDCGASGVALDDRHTFRDPPSVPVADGRASAASFRRELAEVMWRHASVVRSRDSLEAAHEWIASATRHAPAHEERCVVAGGREIYEADNLALLGSLLLQSALLREESRGAHFRSDFPQREPGWRGHIVVSTKGVRYLPLEQRADGTQPVLATQDFHA